MKYTHLFAWENETLKHSWKVQQPLFLYSNPSASSVISGKLPRETNSYMGILWRDSWNSESCSFEVKVSTPASANFKTNDSDTTPLLTSRSLLGRCLLELDVVGGLMYALYVQHMQFFRKLLWIFLY